MVNLEITDGAVTNYHFKELFERSDVKRIGIRLSSGTDSALVLFFLAKFITETESFDKVIFPWTGLELNNKLSFAKERAIQILNLIREMYPKVDIRDIHFDSWLRVPPYEDPADKNRYSNPLAEKFRLENNLDAFLSGITSNPPKEIRDQYEMVTEHCISAEHRNPENMDTHEYWEGRSDSNIPWKKHDKKFIAHQYKKYNLMENLYPLTESCVIETVDVLLNMGSPSFPCKKCFWCREKYWAFGSYDGAIQ
jgi:hypothetical protein